ncbi:MAG: hypothetical protein R2771_02665 [Saprospiraceae bacterium]
MKTLKIIIYVFIVLILSGCYSQTYYSNLGSNVPLLKEKNDFQCYSSVGNSSGKINEYYGGIAYSMIDQFAISGNYIYSYNHDEEVFGQSGNYYDIAAGYYNSFGSLWKIEKPFIYDIYLGYGKDYQHHIYYSRLDIIDSKLKMNKLFVQSSLGFSTKLIDIAFAGRISRLSYCSVEPNMVSGDDLEKLLQISSQKNFYRFEPSFTFQIGWKHIKFREQLFISYSNKPEIIEDMMGINFGFIYLLSNRFKN